MIESNTYYSTWRDLVSAFLAEQIYVDVSGADRELIEEFVAELNDEDIFFPSKRTGEMPINFYMYYVACDGIMYSTGSAKYLGLKDRDRVPLRDCGCHALTIDEVNHECFEAVL